MKKLFSILFAIGLVAAFVAGNGTVALCAGTGLMMALASSHVSEYAYLSIVPAIMRDPADLSVEVSPMTRAEKALFDQLITLNRANPVTQDAIRQGGISFNPVSYYIRFNITGLSGNQKFVSSSTIKSIGTTNIPNNATLPQYTNFCFDRIQVRTTITNTANTAINTVGSYTSVMASVDPAVRNGELIVRSNRNIIVETPVTDYLCESLVSGGGAREYAGGILEKPRFFLELLGIEAEIALAGTVAATANTTTYLEVIFCGVEARLKA
jgi:hypothetical protein